MDKEGLAITQKLAPNGGGDLLILVGTDVSQNRVAIFWRGENGRHFADTRHGHLQRAGNRRRGHG